MQRGVSNPTDTTVEHEATALRDVELARQLLADHRPRRRPERHTLARAAVAMFLSDHFPEGLSVLMIKRAERSGDPWSGHMAFPGGRQDAADADSLATARRETSEEIGLQVEAHGTLLARLSDVITQPRLTGNSMVITPYVFQLSSIPELVPNHEVAAIVWVPLAFLADRANRQKMRWAPNDVPLELPCYFYGEYRIWGLSLLMLDELLDILV